MAYVYMPLFFSILSYGIVYLITSDMISLATGVTQLIMTESDPDFSVDYANTFNPGSVEISNDNTVKRADVPQANYGIYMTMSNVRILDLTVLSTLAQTIPF